MAREIRHSFLIDAPPDAALRAVVREEDIRRWWTHEARIEAGRAVLGWSGHGWTVELDMEHDAAARRATWRCIRSNMQDTDAWEGTTITFVLTPEAGGTRLDFAQTGYRDSPCYETCEQGWAFFVGTSLRRYLETGCGLPYPEMQGTRPA